MGAGAADRPPRGMTCPATAHEPPCHARARGIPLAEAAPLRYAGTAGAQATPRPSCLLGAFVSGDPMIRRNAPRLDPAGPDPFALVLVEIEGARACPQPAPRNAPLHRVRWRVAAVAASGACADGSIETPLVAPRSSSAWGRTGASADQNEAFASGSRRWLGTGNNVSLDRSHHRSASVLALKHGSFIATVCDLAAGPRRVGDLCHRAASC